jgi:hypothetical protein
MNYKIIQNLSDSMYNHFWTSIFCLLVALYILWWLRKCLTFQWELQIKDHPFSEWQSHGLFDSPGEAYEYLEDYRGYVDEYRLCRHKPVKQISGRAKRRLMRKIHSEEIAANKNLISQ